MKAEDIFIKAIEALQDNLDEFEKSIKWFLCTFTSHEISSLKSLLNNYS
jgi:hypothetical protein